MPVKMTAMKTTKNDDNVDNNDDYIDGDDNLKQW